MTKYFIPKEVFQTLKTLEESGFSAYIVGGCVRDILLDRDPKDWDIATNALPEQIQGIFEDTVYENNFGTVGLKTDSQDLKLKIIEITTFRRDEEYSDRRHPDSVAFTESIEEDLARRDFTINAIAMKMEDEAGDVRFAKLIDPFEGADDLKKRHVRAVGDPSNRFGEDALRIMRAVRFAAELDFDIEEETAKAINHHAAYLKEIAMERIRDEFEKLVMCERAAYGIVLLEKRGLLEFIIPELREGIGESQNKHHKYTVFEHNLKSLHYAAKKGYALDVRIAALLHDVAKPRTKRGEGADATFYGHQVVGERMAKKILKRLRFSKLTIDHVALLIREHMFVYDIGEVTDAGVRRLVRRVGKENIDDLFRLRQADRIGSGVPKAQPYRLRHLKYMIDKVSRDPISVGMLNIDGNDIMEMFNVEPSPKIGLILNALLGEVLEDPANNDPTFLKKRARELIQCEEDQLRNLADKGKQARSDQEDEIDNTIKKKHYVK